MIKKLGAFFLGVLSVPVLGVFVELGDLGKFLSGWPGVFVECIVMAAYFFICQFWLSHGNPNAFLKDWTIMFWLNTPLFLMLFMGFFTEKNMNATYAAQSSAVLLFCFAGTLAGAFAASRAARRGARRQVV